MAYFYADMTGPHFEFLQPDFEEWFVPPPGSDGSEGDDSASQDRSSDSEGSIDGWSKGEDACSLDSPSTSQGSNDVPRPFGPCDSSEESIVSDSDPEDEWVGARRRSLQTSGSRIGSILPRPRDFDPLPRTYKIMLP